MIHIEKNTISSRFLRRCVEVAWPFGAFQKTNDPHKAIENLERTSAAATLWILAGIMVEMLALFIFDHSRLELVVGVVANGAIGLGLIVEYLVIGKVIDATKEAERESNERIAQIEEGAAQARAQAAGSMALAADAQRQGAALRKQAAEAELQLAEFKKRLEPREIDSGIFLEVINGKPKAPVEVKYVRDDADSFHLAIGISSLLKQAGWEVAWASPINPSEYPRSDSPSAMAAGGQPTGVSVVGHISWLRRDEPAPWDDDTNFDHNPYTGLSRALGNAMGGQGGGGLSIDWPVDKLRVVVGPRR
jgi:hypothetical protein